MISIAARIRPFSHTPGNCCLLPKSCWLVQAFPTLLCLRSLERAVLPIEIPLRLTGPVREFTLQQDLEKGCVWVWGTAIEGRFRLRLEALNGSLKLSVEEAPLGMLADRREWDLPGTERKAPGFLERVSFGLHKAQDWDLVQRRSDPQEILPILFALSQWTPFLESPKTEMFELLKHSDENFLRAAFFGILCPRLLDEQHQGLLVQETVPAGASALALIAAAGAKLRGRLLEQRGNRIRLFAPTEIFGRMVGALLEGIGRLDFEWRQGSIRRAVLHAKQNIEVAIELPKALQSFRLRLSLHGRGSRVKAGSLLPLEKDRVYFLDRFEK